MKKLTMAQLSEVKVFNPHYFTQWHRGGWWVHHSSDTWHGGWFLCASEFGSKRFYCRDGRAKPDAFRQEVEPLLESIGKSWPDEWIKFMGVWMDKAIYDRRMAELVAEYKAKVKS